MKIPEKYTVKPIDPFQCKEWLMYKHYAKRIPSISWSFGLYDNATLSGVMTIGKPASPSLCVGVCGENYSEYVYELNRLCVNEGLEKNTLSYFVSTSLGLIKDKLIIVSYADTSKNHHGYIYQATNWIYTGLSEKRTDTKAVFSNKHSRHGFKDSKKRGLTHEREERPQKHRYIYFLGTRNDKKVFLKELKYSIQPYPKGDNKRYNADYKPTVQIPLF